MESLIGGGCLAGVELGLVPHSFLGRRVLANGSDGVDPERCCNLTFEGCSASPGERRKVASLTVYI